MKFKGKSIKDSYNNFWKNTDFEKAPKLQRVMAGLFEKRFWSDVLDLFEKEKSKSLLDAGCGCGFFLEFASKRNFSLFGVDVSRVAVNMTKEKVASAKVVIGDLEKLPYADNCFDSIFCHTALEHVPDQDAALFELHRILRNGGKAVIVVPNKYSLGNIFMVYKTGNAPEQAGQSFSEVFHTKIEWKNKIESNGLVVKEIVKSDKIWATEKVSTFTTFLYNFFISPFVPLNLSYNFIFICKKECLL